MKAAREFVSDMAEHVSMPEVYVAIRRLLLNSETTIDDFVEVVERDSMLAVRVMHMAQSQYFGFPRNCGSLYQAIGLIGLMQLHDLMLATLCMRSFATIPEEVLNLKAFWRYNVQCGIAARTIGQFGKAESHHVFFTLGLLHEIGHAAMFLKAPEASLRALDDSQSELCTFAEAERQHLGFDYGQVGSELMQVWHLPPVYQQVAACHLEPERAERGYRPAVEVVHLAHQFCQDSSRGRYRELIERSIESMPEFSRLPQNIDQIIADEIETHTDPVLELLWPRCASILKIPRGGRAHV
jgi:HD-like signal output (HDOD) protein